MTATPSPVDAGVDADVDAGPDVADGGARPGVVKDGMDPPSRLDEQRQRLGGGPVGSAAPVTGPAAPPAAPPTAYDVTDTAAMNKLAASPNKADQEVAAMMKAANKTYADLLTKGVKISVIAQDPGNSNKPVLCLVPKAVAANPNQKFETQVHYQGMYSTPGTPDPSTGAAKKLGAQLDGPPPRVFILPGPVELRGGSFPDWTCVKNTRQTADVALKAAGLPVTGGADHQLIVSGHSAGGRAIGVAQDRGGLDCDRLELQDCLYRVPKGRPDSTYSSAHDAAIAWAKANPGKSLSYVRSNEGDNGDDLTASNLPTGTAFKRVVVQHHNDAYLRQP